MSLDRLVPLVLLTLALCGCDDCDERSYSEGCPPGSYPRCSADGMLLRCLGDDDPLEEHEYLDQAPCPPGTVCLDGYNLDDQRWAECLWEGAAPCDPALFEVSCVEGGVLLCIEAGYTSLLPCRQGEVCVQGLAGPTCAQAGSTACDPAIFEEICDEGRPAWCDSDGGVVIFDAACMANQVCRLGARGAVCTSADAEPCERDGFVEHCDGAGFVMCGWDTAFTERFNCPGGSRCMESETSAACFGSDQPDCDAGTFVSRCDGDTAWVHCSSFGVEERLSCFSSEVCRTNDSGAHCVAPEAEVCDQESFVRRCDGEQLVACTSYGFTRSYSCPDGETCRSSALGSACAAPDAELCEPDSFADRCEGQELIACGGVGFVERDLCEAPATCRVSALGPVCTTSTGPVCEQPWSYLRCVDGALELCDWQGFERIEPCAEGTMCVEGDYGYLGWPIHAYCVDEAAPSCDGTAPVSCAGEHATLCFGGYLVEEGCGSAICVTDGALWTCVASDAPRCDPQVDVASCIDATTLQRCFGEPPTEVSYVCSGDCVEDGGGARCD